MVARSRSVSKQRLLKTTNDKNQTVYKPSGMINDKQIKAVNCQKLDKHVNIEIVSKAINKTSNKTKKSDNHKVVAESSRQSHRNFSNTLHNSNQIQNKLQKINDPILVAVSTDDQDEELDYEDILDLVSNESNEFPEVENSVEEMDIVEINRQTKSPQVPQGSAYGYTKCPYSNREIGEGQIGTALQRRYALKS